MKVIPKIKVSEIPFKILGEKITYEEKERYGLIMSNGEINYYRLEFMRGHGGNYREKTWNRQKHRHDCCKSKVPWRHRVICPRMRIVDDLKNAPDDYSDLKDIIS